VLAVLRRIPAVAALATDSRTPPLRAGPLVDRRGRAGRRLAGSLVPQPEVVVDGRTCRLDDVLGPDSTELRLQDGVLVLVRPGGSGARVDDPSGRLAAWLRRGRASAVTIRPDRIVASARP
jgi:3-(3-hydroxy-phenyl)propionate hydroxylase